MKTILSLFMLGLLSLGPGSAGAQQPAESLSYPARPVKVIVPNAAGAALDLIGRVVALKLSELTGGQFYVENVPRAGGLTRMGGAAAGAPRRKRRLTATPSWSSIRILSFSRW